jgi:hypothetical protein
VSHPIFFLFFRAKENAASAGERGRGVGRLIEFSELFLRLTNEEAVTLVEPPNEVAIQFQIPFCAPFGGCASLIS